MAKKQSYNPKSFEIGINPPKKMSFASIYSPMTSSLSWKELKPRQRNLYVAMKMQYFSNNKPNKEDVTQFCFNWSMAQQLCGYTNQESFRIDRDRLIELGFIKVIGNGYTTRENNVYAYSSMWSRYGTDEFVIHKSEMSTSMLHKLNDNTNDNT